MDNKKEITMHSMIIIEQNVWIKDAISKTTTTTQESKWWYIIYYHNKKFLFNVTTSKYIV